MGSAAKTNPVILSPDAYGPEAVLKAMKSAALCWHHLPSADAKTASGVRKEESGGLEVLPAAEMLLPSKGVLTCQNLMQRAPAEERAPLHGAGQLFLS